MTLPLAVRLGETDLVFMTRPLVVLRETYLVFVTRPLAVLGETGKSLYDEVYIVFVDVQSQ